MNSARQGTARSDLPALAPLRLCVKPKRLMTENQLSKVIVDAAIEVHRELGGPGLIEDVYEEALEEELRLRSIQVDRQLPVRIVYKGKLLRKPLRLDMRVEKLVLVDNKAV